MPEAPASIFHLMLGVRDAEQIALHPMRGALFENLIVSEALKARLNAGQRPLRR